MPRHPLPDSPKEGFSLLEQGAVLVLMRHITQTQAETSVASLRAGIGDWNEARVCQAQELAQYIKTSSRRKGMELLNSRAPAARDLKDYLQDVFQQTHGLDLEFFREESTDVGKIMEDFSVLDMPSTAYLFWVATEGQVTIHLPLLKLLDRLGLITRTTSLTKGKASVEALVSEKDRFAFNLSIHEVLGHWYDDLDPSYVIHDVLRTLPYGKKAFEDREAALKREEIARQKEEAREALAAKREAERVAKEDEKERKRQEAIAARVQRERDKQKRISARKAAAEAKKKAAKDKVESDKKAKVAKRVAEEKAKANKKKAEAKKAAAKKVADKKAASKKGSSKKAASKSSSAKKSAPKKKPAAKAAPKKSVSKKAKAEPAKKAGGAKPAKKGQREDSGDQEEEHAIESQEAGQQKSRHQSTRGQESSAQESAGQEKSRPATRRRPPKKPPARSAARVGWPSHP